MIKKIKKSNNTSYIKPHAKKLQAFLLKLFGGKFEDRQRVYDDYIKNTEKYRKKFSNQEKNKKKLVLLLN